MNLFLLLHILIYLAKARLSDLTKLSCCFVFSSMNTIICSIEGFYFLGSSLRAIQQTEV